MLAMAKPRTPIDRRVPTNTSAVEPRSPSRFDTVSMADFALYLASHEVGRNSACWIVFWSE